jgi:CheY-like chemotaxis protein
MADKLNILIVDDEESLRCSLGNILEVQGYRVTMVEDGLKAIEEVKKGNFNGMFLDIKIA